MLIFKKSDKEICITNEHGIFEDTDFVKMPFKIWGIPLNGVQKNQIEQKHTKIKRGVERQDRQAIQSEFFEKQVSRWEGIGIEEDNSVPTALECTIANKQWLAKQWFGFTQLVNAAFLNKQVEVEKQKEEEIKNLKSSGTGK